MFYVAKVRDRADVRHNDYDVWLVIVPSNHVTLDGTINSAYFDRFLALQEARKLKKADALSTYVVIEEVNI